MCFATPGSSPASSGPSRSYAAASPSCCGVVRRFSLARLLPDCGSRPASAQDCLGGWLQIQPPRQAIPIVWLLVVLVALPAIFTPVCATILAQLMPVLAPLLLVSLFLREIALQGSPI